MLHLKYLSSSLASHPILLFVKQFVCCSSFQIGNIVLLIQWIEASEEEVESRSDKTGPV